MYLQVLRIKVISGTPKDPQFMVYLDNINDPTPPLQVNLKHLFTKPSWLNAVEAAWKTVPAAKQKDSSYWPRIEITYENQKVVNVVVTTVF